MQIIRWKSLESRPSQMFRNISASTGDGYYENVVLDPEGNLIELTV